MAQPQTTQDADAIDALPGLDSSDAAPKKSRLNPIADKLFRPVRLAKFACLIGLAVFLPYFVQHLPNLAARPEYRLRTSMIRVVPASERPVPEDLVEQVRRLNDLPRELSLLDPRLCPNLAAAFAKHPWIAKVVSVKQSFPADVVIEVEYRRPMAMAQVKGGRIPIDGEGVVLPSEDFSVSDVPRYPTIRLAGAGNMSQTGNRITEPGLIGAARAAQLLAPKWSELELEAIELPRDRSSIKKIDDIVLQLQTKGGSVIIWGRAPGTSHPGELTAPQKLARMEKYHSEFGGFDRPSGPYEIDIRHWQEITRKPAAKAQAARKDSRSRR